MSRPTTLRKLAKTKKPNIGAEPGAASSGKHRNQTSSTRCAVSKKGPVIAFQKTPRSLIQKISNVHDLQLLLSMCPLFEPHRRIPTYPPTCVWVWLACVPALLHHICRRVVAAIITLT
eukprot:3425785-Karenia_brevis.AAC.1